MKIIFTRTFALLIILVLIWGVSWSVYKSAMPYTPPILFAGMRTLLGGLLLTLCLLPVWRRLNWRENWKLYCVSAVLNSALFYGLQTIGLDYLPGGLISVIVYMQPVLIGLFAWMWLGEKMTVPKVSGLLLGFAGVLVIGADSLNGSISVFGVLIAFGAAVSWALGVVYVKKVSPRVDSMWMVAMQSLLGGIALTLLGTSVESWSDITVNSTYLTGVLFGSTLGIPVAFLIYFHLINNGEASRVAAFTFLVPLIAVLIGTVFMDEPFTVSLAAGLVLIVLSISLVNFRRKPEVPPQLGRKAVKTPH